VLGPISNARREDSAAVADFCADLVSRMHGEAADLDRSCWVELVPGIVDSVAANAVRVCASLFDRVAAVAVYSDPVAAVRGRATASD